MKKYVIAYYQKLVFKEFTMGKWENRVRIKDVVYETEPFLSYPTEEDIREFAPKKPYAYAMIEERYYTE